MDKARERERDSDVNNVCKPSEVSFEGQAAVGWVALCLIELGTKPEVFPPDLWIFRLDEARSSCPAEREKKKHIDPSLIKCVGFQGQEGIEH